MLSLISLEFRKLLASRSARIALLVCALLPFLWSFAPRLNEILRVDLVSGWQLPAVSIGVAVQFLMPLFIAVTVAEMIGAEVAQGTLAPLLLRPVSRTRVIVGKLVVALFFPLLLVVATLLGSLVAGIPHGYGEFRGGTGLGPGLFQGVGMLSPSGALAEVLRGGLLTWVMLMPVAALSLFFGVLLLGTSAAALATLATLSVLRLMVVFPEGLQRVLLTSYLNLYVTQGSLTQALVLLFIYTLGFSLMAIFAFDRRDL